MNDACRHLEQVMQLVSTNRNHYKGSDDGFSLPNPYGGRLLGQAVSAAAQSLDHDRSLHSMHAYFMRTGKRDQTISYEVNPLRDGGSFSSRGVEAIQADQVLFSCICGFHTFEENVQSQLIDMPDAPKPETLASNEPWPEMQLYERLAKKTPLHPIRAFDLRFVPDQLQARGQGHKRQLWVKCHGPLANARLHEALFTWFSDFFLLPTVLKPLGITLGDQKMRIASLDHALWIHRPLKIDQWLLFDFSSTSYGHSRAHTEAKVFDQSGALVASLVQEGLVQLAGDE